MYRNNYLTLKVNDSKDSQDDFYYSKLNEDIFRVDGLFYCLWFYCDTSRLRQLNHDRKKALTKVRFLVKPIHGVNLERAFNFYSTFLQISSIQFLKVSLLSNFTPTDFLHLLFFVTQLSILGLIRQCYKLSGTYHNLHSPDYY